MIKPGDYIIEVKEQIRPDGYPACHRTLGRFYISKEFMEEAEEDIVRVLIERRVMGLLK